MRIKFLDILNEELNYPFPTKKEVKISTDNGREILLDVEIPTTNEEKMQGAMYRDDMCDNCGILFLNGGGEYHMHDVNFPLDMIFINDNTIVDIKTVNPEEDGITSDQEFDHNLEVNGGFCEKNNISVGNKVFY